MRITAQVVGCCLWLEATIATAGGGLSSAKAEVKGAESATELRQKVAIYKQLRIGANHAQDAVPRRMLLTQPIASLRGVAEARLLRRLSPVTTRPVVEIRGRVLHMQAACPQSVVMKVAARLLGANEVAVSLRLPLAGVRPIFQVTCRASGSARFLGTGVRIVATRPLPALADGFALSKFLLSTRGLGSRLNIQHSPRVASHGVPVSKTPTRTNRAGRAVARRPLRFARQGEQGHVSTFNIYR